MIFHGRFRFNRTRRVKKEIKKERLIYTHDLLTFPVTVRWNIIQFSFSRDNILRGNVTGQSLWIRVSRSLVAELNIPRLVDGKKMRWIFSVSGYDSMANNITCTNTLQSTASFNEFSIEKRWLKNAIRVFTVIFHYFL